MCGHDDCVMLGRVSTMTLKPLLLWCATALPLLGGCSDDPPASTPFGPGSGQPGSGDGGAEGGGLLGDGGFAYDAADPQKDAGYRDPQGSDGGCPAPNQVRGG